jgi:mutator protein MutT
MIVRVAAAIIRREDRFLITRRPDHVHLPGLWEFPGGKIEPNESSESALVRELKEEIDVDVAVGSEYFSIQHDYPERSVQLSFFNCRIVSGEPKALHVAEFRWVKAGELQHYEFPEADRELVLRLQIDSRPFTS